MYFKIFKSKIKNTQNWQQSSNQRTAGRKTDSRWARACRCPTLSSIPALVALLCGFTFTFFIVFYDTLFFFLLFTYHISFSYTFFYWLLPFIPSDIFIKYVPLVSVCKLWMGKQAVHSMSHHLWLPQSIFLHCGAPAQLLLFFDITPILSKVPRFLNFSNQGSLLIFIPLDHWIWLLTV